MFAQHERLFSELGSERGIEDGFEGFKGMVKGVFDGVREFAEDLARSSLEMHAEPANFDRLLNFWASPIDVVLESLGPGFEGEVGFSIESGKGGRGVKGKAIQLSKLAVGEFEGIITVLIFMSDSVWHIEGGGGSDLGLGRGLERGLWLENRVWAEEKLGRGAIVRESRVGRNGGVDLDWGRGSGGQGVGVGEEGGHGFWVGCWGWDEPVDWEGQWNQFAWPGS